MKLLHNYSPETYNAYGAFLDQTGTKVEVDDEMGLLEQTDFMVSKHSYHQQAFGVQMNDVKTRTGYKKRTGNKRAGDEGGGQGGAKKGSQSEGRKSAKNGAKKGRYDLWGDRDSESDSSSSSSGSSDEIFDRGSTTSTSTHSCHERRLSAQREGSVSTIVKMSVVAVMSLGFVVVEFIAGYYSSSLAIFSDAAIFLGDFLGLIVTFVALQLARKSPNAAMNFGYLRAEILGSLGCVTVMWILTGLLTYEAALRIMSSDFTLDAHLMLIISSIGLAINVLIVIISHGCRCSGKSGKPEKRSVFQGSLFIRTSFVQVTGNLLRSAGLVIAAVILTLFPDYKILDPIVTLVFGFIVILSSISILRHITHVLMEGCPKEVSFYHLMEDLEGLPGVRAVHDLHLWTLGRDENALAVHIAKDQSFSNETIFASAQKILKEKYDVFHSTIQVEPYHEKMSSCKGCITGFSSK